MYIDPGYSSELVDSVQRDYRAAAEAYRQAKMVQESKPVSATLVRVGIALAGLIALVIAVGQTIPV